MNMVRRGMVFGVFDVLHEGHKNFLNAAFTACEELVVAVAPDSVVKDLKGRAPRQTLEERLLALSRFNSGLRAVPGDLELGSWEVLKKEQPNVVFLGYDQEALKQELLVLGTPYIVLAPHEPDRFKSSVLNEP